MAKFFMKGKAEKKVPGGKLVKVSAEFGETIKSVKITGDFFLHPEEAIELIEKSLLGIGANEQASAFEKAISETTKKNDIQMIGVSARDIAETVREAVSK